MNYIALTMGNPEGIGPEIILKSYNEIKEIKKDAGFIPVVIGIASVFEYYNKLYKLNIPLNVLHEWDAAAIKPNKLNILDIGFHEFEVKPGTASITGAKAAYESIILAIDLTQMGELRGIVTAPVSKDSLIQADLPFTGHTDILLVKAKTGKYAMTLYYDGLFVMHLTGHKPLHEALLHVTSDNIVEMIIMAYKFALSTGLESPRIGVAGLNPHAGENGLLGTEEIREIIPAIGYCRSQNIDVSGPVAPDAIFEAEYRKKYDIVIALYHDQGHIPIKALGRDKAVQMTVGIPFVRTSPAHGTAFDIAGKGKASPDSFVEAYNLAAKLIGSGK